MDFFRGSREFGKIPVLFYRIGEGRGGGKLSYTHIPSIEREWVALAWIRKRDHSTEKEFGFASKYIATKFKQKQTSGNLRRRPQGPATMKFKNI